MERPGELPLRSPVTGVAWFKRGTEGMIPPLVVDAPPPSLSPDCAPFITPHNHGGALAMSRQFEITGRPVETVDADDFWLDQDLQSLPSIYETDEVYEL